MKAYNRYIEKLRKSKKINDFLLLRKKRAGNKAIPSWPSDIGGSKIDENSILCSVYKFQELVFLYVQCLQKVKVKEYGLNIVLPTGEDKIVLRTEEQSFNFERETIDITQYKGVFYFYLVLENGKVLVAKAKIVNAYDTDDHNDITAYSFYCNTEQYGYLEINNDAMTQKNISQIKLVNENNASIYYSSSSLFKKLNFPNKLYFKTPRVLVCGKYNIYINDSNYDKEIKIQGENNAILFCPSPSFFFSYECLCNVINISSHAVSTVPNYLTAFQDFDFGSAQLINELGQTKILILI